MNELGKTSTNGAWFIRFILRDRIGFMLREYGISQYKLAEAMGISSSTLSQKLAGKIRFNAEDICVIADLFDVSADVLLGRAPLVVS